MTAGMFVLIRPAHSGQVAFARMHCLSLRFEYGYGQTGLERLDLTTISNGVNGELAPLYGAYSHWSTFALFDQMWGTLENGVLFLSTPAFRDANNNGFDDFFEVTQPVSATSTGSWHLLGETATHPLTATWTRAQGSTTGQCILNLEGKGEFTHQFSLLEFAGMVVYVHGQNFVTGTVTLTQTGATNNVLGGQVVFVKAPHDRANRLELQSGILTNAQGDSFVYVSELFCRQQLWPSNYTGFVNLIDGDPQTPDEADYWLWLLGITDTNDTDGDGIPDFSDDPAQAPAQTPTLQLTLGTTNLILQIRGEPGHLYEILESDSIVAADWVTNQVVMLTNETHVVNLPIPSGPRFWRARMY